MAQCGRRSLIFCQLHHTKHPATTMPTTCSHVAWVSFWWDGACCSVFSKWHIFNEITVQKTHRPNLLKAFLLLFVPKDTLIASPPFMQKIHITHTHACECTWARKWLNQTAHKCSSATTTIGIHSLNLDLDNNSVLNRLSENQGVSITMLPSKLWTSIKQIRLGQRKCRVKYFGLFFSENLGLQKTSSTIVGTDIDWKIRCPHSPANGHLLESPLG